MAAAAISARRILLGVRLINPGTVVPNAAACVGLLRSGGFTAAVGATKIAAPSIGVPVIARCTAAVACWKLLASSKR